jgi:hypothetical protein
MTITVTWSAPSNRESGRPISDAEIASYDLQMKVEGAPTFTSIMNAKKLTFTVDIVDPGLYQFQCFTVDSQGRRSKPAAGEVTIQDTTSPGSPVNFTVALS